MMAKPINTPELHYPMIQFLLIFVIALDAIDGYLLSTP